MGRIKLPLTRRDKYSPSKENEEVEFPTSTVVYKPKSKHKKLGFPFDQSYASHTGSNVPLQGRDGKFYPSQPNINEGPAYDESHMSRFLASNGGGGVPQTPVSEHSVFFEDQQKNTGLRKIPELPLGFDAVDYQIKYYASICDVLFCVLGFVVYLADVVTDVVLCIKYFQDEQYLWFGLTLGFVAVPALSITVFSLSLYIRDVIVIKDKPHPVLWIPRGLFLLLQLAPLFRILETLFYACKSRFEHEPAKQNFQYARMVDEATDSTFLRLLEAFMEAAPQLVLQIFILTQTGLEAGVLLAVLQCVSMGTSLTSLSFSLVSFHKALRKSQDNKAPLTIPGMIGMFIWRFFTVGSRVLAIGMFVSAFTYIAAGVVGLHWIVMLIWIFQQNTNYCQLKDEKGKQTFHPCAEYGFRFMVSFVHIFAFFNLLEGHSRLRAVFYYAIVGAENIGMMIAWFVGTSMLGDPVVYQSPVIILATVGFFIGILFMVLYYIKCHPNNESELHRSHRIKWLIPCSELSLIRDLEEHLHNNTYEEDPEEGEYLNNQTEPEVRPTRQLTARELAMEDEIGSDSLNQSSVSSPHNRSAYIRVTQTPQPPIQNRPLAYAYRPPESVDTALKPARPPSTQV